MGTKKLARLDVDVIDRAITYIKNGACSQTCTALGRASAERGPYRKQWTRYNNPQGSYPGWWNGSNSGFNRGTSH